MKQQSIIQPKDFQHWTGAFTWLLVLSLLGFSAHSKAQDSTGPKKIAVFLPLYLDSAFDAAGNFKPGKTWPAYATQGMEFYEGMQAAIDSLNREKIEVEIRVYDSRSLSEKPETIANSAALDNTSLIIGLVNVNEASLLARIAQQKNIPFVNANLPNEAGISANPYYTILNPTLQTHVTGLYKFLQKNYALSPIIYFKKKGAVEDRLKNGFMEAERSSASVPLKMKTINLDDSISNDQLKMFFDTSKQNVCIIGSLDLNYGLALMQQLISLGKAYRITVIGMPTWEQADLTKAIYKGIEVVYSNPMYINPENKTIQQLQNHFRNRYFMRASENVYRGFESIYYYSKLLQSGSAALQENQVRQPQTPIGQYMIVPVTNKKTGQIDYYENKKLYFIRKQDGIIKAVF